MGVVSVRYTVFLTWLRWPLLGLLGSLVPPAPSGPLGPLGPGKPLLGLLGAFFRALGPKGFTGPGARLAWSRLRRIERLPQVPILQLRMPPVNYDSTGRICVQATEAHMCQGYGGAYVS